jgi:hypothetical protein
MVMAVAHSRVETMARAVRDLLADSLTTLPELTADDAGASLHFFFANFRGMRASLCPGWADAYERWCADGELDPLRLACERGREHWADVAQGLLGLYAGGGLGAMSEMVDYVESRRLT